jgi:hypothetical protein
MIKVDGECKDNEQKSRNEKRSMRKYHLSDTLVVYILLFAIFPRPMPFHAVIVLLELLE